MGVGHQVYEARQSNDLQHALVLHMTILRATGYWLQKGRRMCSTGGPESKRSGNGGSGKEGKSVRSADIHQ